MQVLCDHVGITGRRHIIGRADILCTVVEDVRTFHPSNKARVDRLLKDITDSLDDPGTAIMLSNIKLLRERFAPEPLPHLGEAA